MTISVSAITPAASSVLLRTDALQFKVTQDVGSPNDVRVRALFADGHVETLWAEGQFAQRYLGSISTDGDDRTFVIARRAGWPATFTIQVDLAQLTVNLDVVLADILLDTNTTIIPGMVDWLSAVSGAIERWDADDLANGGAATWTGRGLGLVSTLAGSPVRSLGSNGRGRLLFDGGVTQSGVCPAGSTAAALGTSTTGDWMVVAVAELLAVGASNTGDVADQHIWADSTFRGGATFRKRTTGPDTYALGSYYYDGAFTPAPTLDFGATLTGRRVYYTRKAGTSLYCGVAGVGESALVTKGGGFTGGTGQLRFATSPTDVVKTNLYLSQILTKGNGLLDAQTIAALAGLAGEQ